MGVERPTDHRSEAPLNLSPATLLALRNAGLEVSDDAPVVHVWRLPAGWGIEVADYAPGPGPGDFRVMVRDESALVSTVRAYFFVPKREFEARRRG